MTCVKFATGRDGTNVMTVGLEVYVEVLLKESVVDVTVLVVIVKVGPELVVVLVLDSGAFGDEDMVPVMFAVEVVLVSIHEELPSGIVKRAVDVVELRIGVRVMVGNVHESVTECENDDHEDSVVDDWFTVLV